MRRLLTELTDDRIAAAVGRVEGMASLVPLVPLTAGLLGYAAMRGAHAAATQGTRYLIGVLRG